MFIFMLYLYTNIIFHFISFVINSFFRLKEAKTYKTNINRGNRSYVRLNVPLFFHPWKSIRWTNLINYPASTNPTAIINKSRTPVHFTRGRKQDECKNSRQRTNRGKGRKFAELFHPSRHFAKLQTTPTWLSHFGEKLPRRRRREKKRVFESSTVVGRDPSPRTSGTRLVARSLAQLRSRYHANPKDLSVVFW